MISILFITSTVGVALEGVSSIPPYYPQITDFRESDFLTSWIENKEAKFLLMSYLLLCPEQDMCLGEKFRRNYTFIHHPSCIPCDCDDSCVRKGTCCPSKFYRQAVTPDFIEYMSIEERKQKGQSLSCIEPLWNKKIGITPGKSYWMIETCLSGATCLLPQSKNITNATPVTSLLTNETYLSIQCALCNNESVFDMVPWKREKICLNRSALFSNDELETLHQSVFSVGIPVCNIGFHPPRSIQHMINPCISYTAKIDATCNKIELSEETRALLIDSCQKYYIPYETSNKVYKNIYCALCDKVVFVLTIQNDYGGPGFITYMLSTFSALMDFEGNENEVHTKDFHCGTNQVFDSKMSKCLDIECEAEYMYSNSTCQLRYPMLQNTNYEINLMIAFIEDSNIINWNYHLQDVEVALASILFRHRLSDYLCRISILTPLKTDFLALVLELSVGDFHNVDLMIQKLMNAFSIPNMAISLSSLSRKVNVTLSVVGQRFHMHGNALFGTKVRDRFYVNPMSLEKMYFYQGSSELNYYEYDPKRPLCFQNDIVVVVADWYRCPKIKVNTRDAKIDMSNFSVCLVDYQACFSSNQFKEAQDKRSVEICLDHYLKVISQKNSQREFSEDLLMKYFSLACLSLSSIASLVTILTFFLNKSSHRSVADMNIITLTVLSILANTGYTFSKFFLWNESLCIGIGMLVHFLWLSVICWMSLSTFQIFQTFTTISTVQKKDSTRVLVFLLIDAVLCLAIVALNVIVSSVQSDWLSLGYSPSTCYIADPKMTLFTFTLPVGLFICINSFMFLVTLSRICVKADIRKSKDQSRLSAYLRLSTIVGVAWFFGFLAQFTELQLFSMLHTLFNGGHGVFIYIAFGLPLNLKSLSHRREEKEKNTDSYTTN